MPLYSRNLVAPYPQQMSFREALPLMTDSMRDTIRTLYKNSRPKPRFYLQSQQTYVGAIYAAEKPPKPKRRRSIARGHVVIGRSYCTRFLSDFVWFIVVRNGTKTPGRGYRQYMLGVPPGDALERIPSLAVQALHGYMGTSWGSRFYDVLIRFQPGLPSYEAQTNQTILQSHANVAKDKRLLKPFVRT